MTTITLDLPTAEKFEPLLAPARYKGAYGGRGSGKSHFFAESAVERMAADPEARIVCIREVQKSLKYSAKALVEAKIRDLGVSHLFTVVETEIRRNGGTGVMIFTGMQDHTADSIKSLEAFDVAWCEEAQNLSARSLRLLRPTIRKAGSELWFSWNPDQPTDAVDEMLIAHPPRGAIVVRVNYTDNPFCPEVIHDEAREMAALDLDDYTHVYLGGYNRKAKARIVADRIVVEEFTPGADFDGPYHGADFGFARDPNVLVRCWIAGRDLYIEREAYAVGEDTDAIAEHWKRDVPGCERYVIRADSSRPETISYLQRGGPSHVDPLPQITGVEKWPGSIEDGVAFLRQFRRIVVHPRCTKTQEEGRLYSYKVDPRTGDVLPVIVDAFNNTWDAVRYAVAPLIRVRTVEPFAQPARDPGRFGRVAYRG